MSKAKRNSAAPLAGMRARIDKLDRAILALLAARVELARRAARAKIALGRPVVDEARETTLLGERRQWAKEAGLPAEPVARVFSAIVDLSKRSQRRK
jgi:chorismate mutase